MKTCHQKYVCRAFFNDDQVSLPTGTSTGAGLATFEAEWLHLSVAVVVVDLGCPRASEELLPSFPVRGTWRCPTGRRVCLWYSQRGWNNVRKTLPLLCRAVGRLYIWHITTRIGKRTRHASKLLCHRVGEDGTEPREDN